MPTNDPTVVRSIVLIDDDADFLHVMQRRLQAQRSEFSPSAPVEILAFTDPVEALVNMPADGICVVFLDYNLQEGTGLEWLPKLIKCGLGPVILLTNQNDAKVAAEAFRSGVADYVAKSEVMADDGRLARAIREAVHRFRLETRNVLLTRQLKLVNVELEAKNKRLAELTDTAHQFVDDVAHDFRTPLTVIQQYASIITDGLSGPVTTRQCDHLSVIVEATQDLSEMVDDFLDSSKLRARALSVDRQCHMVTRLFDSVAAILKMRAQPKQVAITQTIEDNTAPFYGDLSKVGRILTNLAINAIKVTPQGGSLHLWARPTRDGDVSVGVTDQGPGIAPHDLNRLFERFQQLGEPQMDGTKGFGLGLNIVKYLTWLNLGKMEVQSEQGKGSTFSFVLPAFDLNRVLFRFLENTRMIDIDDDLWKLQVTPHGGIPALSIVRRLICSCSYPTDIVLPDEDLGVVNVLGISRDPNAWAARLRQAISRFNPEVRREPVQLDIKVEGPWPRGGESVKLIEKLSESLNLRSSDVETDIARRR
jgi:signal transduction histidine kinase